MGIRASATAVLNFDEAEGFPGVRVTGAWAMFTFAEHRPSGHGCAGRVPCRGRFQGRAALPPRTAVFHARALS